MNRSKAKKLSIRTRRETLNLRWMKKKTNKFRKKTSELKRLLAIVGYSQNQGLLLELYRALLHTSTIAIWNQS